MNFKGKHGPLLIAEIGGNHEGNYEYARELTQLAIESDVDYIKYQIYTGDTIVSKVEDPSRNNHFKKFELKNEEHISLAKMANQAGIGYMASVWDSEALDWIDPYIPIYKIGSGDVTAYQIIEKIALKGKPIILSTGISTMDDILRTVEFIQLSNPIYNQPDYLAILQCTSMYPIGDEDANLLTIPQLEINTNLTVGYSDHTIGSKALLYAYLMGAKVLEFHFSDNVIDRSFRDHEVSLTKEDVKRLIEEISDASRFMGNGVKVPMRIEIENNHHISFRRSMYLNRDIEAGRVVEYDDLISLRPNTGIDARYYQDLIGKTLVNDKKAYEKLSWDDFSS
jgi:N,N'-diacetyllegionaminate synthase